MKVIVCGSRHYRDLKYLSSFLDTLFTELKVADLKEVTIINGGAIGADDLSTTYAMKHDCMLSVFPADWARYGRGAGMIRNQKMLIEGKADLVVAFPVGDSRGTRNMMRVADAAGVKVVDALASSSAP